MATMPMGVPQDATVNKTGSFGGAIPGGGPAASPAPISANPGLVPIGQTQANPFAAPTATPTGIVPGAPQTNGINWTDGSNTVTGDFKDTYGAGTGTAISQVLQGLGTATDSAVQSTIANTNLEAGKQYANIQAGEAASGVTPNSSTAALAEGDFYSSVNSQLQQTISGMELGEENTLLGALTGEGTAHGTDPSTLDSIMNGISDWGTITNSVGESLGPLLGA